jgi:hypothetical protein
MSHLVEWAEAVGIRPHIFTSPETPVGFLQAEGVSRREGFLASAPW